MFNIFMVLRAGLYAIENRFPGRVDRIERLMRN